MEAFRLGCTTCKARLTVRDPNAIGQILPCPRCGSMVLIEAPSTPRSPAPSDSSRAAAAAPLISSSFDNIDELLDDTPAQKTVSPKPTVADQRWKGGDSPATMGSDAPAPPATTSASPEVATADDPVAAEGSQEPASAAEVSSTHWGSYGLMLGGGLVGLAVALGTATFFVLRTQNATENATAPLQAEKDSPSNAPVELPLTPDDKPNDSNHETEPEATAVAQVTEEPNELAVQDALPPTTSIQETSPAEPGMASVETKTELDDAELTNDVVSEPNDEAVTNTQMDLADDGLASFAQWLQSPESMSPDQNPAQAPVEPTNPAPRREVAKPVMRPTRPVPATVDIAARLGEEIIALEFRETTLSDALRAVSDYSTIPITIDPNALGRRNLSAGKVINLRLNRASTVGKALDELLSPLKLAYRDVDGQLVVSTVPASRGEMVTIVHEVGDLCGNNPQKATDFFNWLTAFVAPSSWESRGGEANGQIDGTQLKVQQDDTIHYQILVLCERLRVARGIPTRSRIKSEFIELTPKSQLFGARNRPVTLRIWRDSNLDAIAAELERQVEVNVLVDWQALHMAGWSPRDAMKFFCQDEPLGAALDSLLHPMGLDHRVIDGTTIQITSADAIASELEIEFYPLAEGQSFREVSQEVIRQVGADRFQPVGQGVITYDNPSKCLIVSLAQPDHRIVQSILNDRP